MYLSSIIARDLKKIYNNTKVINVELKYEKEIDEFINNIEEANKKTKDSKLKFK